MIIPQKWGKEEVIEPRCPLMSITEKTAKNTI
jgi:hypothetical protein